MKKTASIIIVHWKTPTSLKSQLKILSQCKDFQIIVIDNASTKSIGWVKKDFHSVELIVNKLNRGYAFACNQGVIKAVGEWLLFLNPDVEINLDRIRQMVKYAETNQLDACSLQTNSFYQKPLPTWLSLLVEFTPLVKLVSLDIFKRKTLFGGCLLIKRETFMSTGGWDERFFLWFEDSDLTLRLLKNNYKIGWLNIPIKHSGGESFKKLGKQYQRDIFFHSMNVFAKKHFSLFGQIIVNLIKRRYTQRKLLPEIFAGVSITIPNLKKELLDSFLQNNNLPTSGVEWIVVTSSFQAKYIWAWRKKYSQIRFIPIKKNNGFASTVNIGFRVSSGKWAGTVNDDVILKKGWLKNLLSCQDKNIGSLNPIIFTSKGDVESIGVKIFPKGKAQKLKIEDFGLVHLRDGRIKDAPDCIQVDSINAATVVYSKESLNKVGIFDERFRSYLEDIDLSLRLKRASYKNIVSLKSKVSHLGQLTSKDLGWGKQYLDFKNWILVILKNWSLKDLLLNSPTILLERLKNLSGMIKALLNF